MSSSHVRQVPETVAHFDREIKMEGGRQTGRGGGGGRGDWPDGEGGGQKRPQGHRNVFEGRREKLMEHFVISACSKSARTHCGTSALSFTPCVARIWSHGFILTVIHHWMQLFQHLFYFFTWTISLVQYVNFWTNVRKSFLFSQLMSVLNWAK